MRKTVLIRLLWIGVLTLGLTHLHGRADIAAARVHSRLAQPSATCSGTTTVLRLATGGHYPNPNLDASYPPPPGMPGGDLVLRVPLYSGAQLDLQTTDPGGYSAPAAINLKSAWTQYVLPTDVNDAVLWYRAAFASCGYGSNAPVACCWLPSAGSAVEYFSGRLMGASLQVQLDFSPLSNDQTLVLYIAQALFPPAKGLAAPLLKGARRATVTYQPPVHQVPTPPVLHFTITARAAIARLVSSISALRVDTRITFACPLLYDRESATVTLMRRSGAPVTLKVDPDCGTVVIAGSLRLLDGVGPASVWNMLTTLVPPRGYHPCNEMRDPSC